MWGISMNTSCEQHAARDGNHEMYSVKQMATMLGVSVGLIYKKATAKEISHHRLGNRIVFAPSHIDEYLKKTEVSDEADPLVVTGFRHLKL